MSRLAQPNGDDHPEAAGKHLVDAEVLIAASRTDGAGYLAGYVIECSLKSVIQLGSSGPATGHNLHTLSSEALRLAALPSSRVARYSTTINSSSPICSGWRPDIRYRAPGRLTMPEARSWVAEARNIFTSTIVKMRLDGVI